MLRLRIPMALILAAAVIALTSASVAAHNAGCVPTGSGETWVFVGSNKESPAVPEQNPNSRHDAVRGGNFLDLQPDGPGDQFGARSAADQGNSAVARPNPNLCEAMGPREDNSP